MKARQPTSGRKALWGASIGAAAAFVSMLAWSAGWLDSIEAPTWDWRVRQVAAPADTTDDVVIIALDQASLDWAEDELELRWPWPREAYSYVVAFCERSGATAVAFDVLYTEASPYHVEDDRTFGAAIKSYGHFVAAVFLGRDAGKERSWPDAIPRTTIRIDGLDGIEAAGVFESEAIAAPRATFPITEVASNAWSVGNVHVDADADGVYRRSPLFAYFDGKFVPNLSLALYLAAHPAAELRYDGEALWVDNTAVWLDERGRAVLSFRGPTQTHTTLTAASIIKSELTALEGGTPAVDLDVLKDKYVLFAFTAPGLYDVKASPFGAYPGVEVHATALDNILADDFIREQPALSVWGLVFVLALLTGISATRVSGVARSVAVQIVAIALPVALVFVAYEVDVWMPLVPMELAVLLTLPGAGAVKYAMEGRQKRFIKNAFKQYLSPIYIEQLISHPERLKLGGERREISIFFSDLEGFTGISEGLSPEDLTALLNTYLSAMTDLVQEEGGTVDKYEGDAIIAFWNAPLDQSDHASRAVRSALRCQEKLTALRPVFQERYGCTLHMRIGINTGPAVVGNLGSHTRFDYTMLGDAVNLAARLEGLNKVFGTYTMISESTFSAASDVAFARPIGRVGVVGRTEPVAVFEPMTAAEHLKRRDALSAFEQARLLYEEGEFEAAAARFAALAPEDPVAAAYASACEALANEAPTRWDGVWVTDKK